LGNIVTPAPMIADFRIKFLLEFIFNINETFKF